VAAGSQSSYYGHDEWRQWAPSLKTIEEATNVRHKILYAFEVAERISDPGERRAWLTFVLVGAGPTGVELAGAIGEIARQTLRKDFRAIYPEEAQIILVDGASRLLMPFPEDLARRAEASLKKLGVQVKYGAMVKNIDRDGLDIEVDKHLERIAAKTVIWSGGVTASPLGRLLASRTNAETDRGGRVKVKADLTIPNYPDIYVVGDLAAAMDAKGVPLPGLAQVAMQGGAYAARSILRKVDGQPPLPPFAYFDKGTMAVIGRASAIANAFGFHVSGLPAWVMWSVVHLMYLVQFQSRVLVFIQWVLQDLTFKRGARLITGSAPTDFNFNKEVATLRNTTEIKSGEVA
jgi:NADH dehydrogenase